MKKLLAFNVTVVFVSVFFPLPTAASQGPQPSPLWVQYVGILMLISLIVFVMLLSAFSAAVFFEFVPRLKGKLPSLRRISKLGLFGSGLVILLTASTLALRAQLPTLTCTIEDLKLRLNGQSDAREWLNQPNILYMLEGRSLTTLHISERDLRPEDDYGPYTLERRNVDTYTLIDSMEVRPWLVNGVHLTTMVGKNVSATGRFKLIERPESRICIGPCPSCKKILFIDSLK